MEKPPGRLAYTEALARAARRDLPSAVAGIEVWSGSLMGGAQTEAAVTLGAAADGSLVGLGYRSGRVDLWDASQAAQVGTLQVSGRIDVLALAPAGNWLAIGYDSRPVEVHSLGRATRSIATLLPSGKGRSAGWKPRWARRTPALAAAFTRDGDALVVLYANGAIGKWNRRLGKWLPDPGALGYPTAQASTVACSTRNEFVVAGLLDGSLEAYSLGTALAKWKAKFHSWPVLQISCAPNTSHGVAIGGDGSVSVWSVDDGIAQAVDGLNDGQATCACWLSDGVRLAVGNRRGELSVWSIKLGRRVGAWRAHAGKVSALVATPVGDLLSLGATGGLYCWTMAATAERQGLAREQDQK